MPKNAAPTSALLKSLVDNSIKESAIIQTSQPFSFRSILRSPGSHRSSLVDMAPPDSSRFGHLPLSTSGPVECALTGSALLNTPYFNKGSAFPKEERQAFGLTGLLPQSIQSLEQQSNRAYQQYATRQDDLAKNTFLTSLKEQNEVLYYRVRNQVRRVFSQTMLTGLQLLQDHLSEMFSVVYTPTEGDAIENFSRLFRRPEGCFLDVHDKARVYQNLAQWGSPDEIDYIVVTGTLLLPAFESFRMLTQGRRGGDLRHRRPRRWRYFDIHCQARSGNSLCRDPSKPHPARGLGLWHRQPEAAGRRSLFGTERKASEGREVR